MNKEKTNTTTSIVEVNKQITKELADPAVVRGLLGTTFKGLSEMMMRQAVFEGVVRGFTFRDFLEKNIYAIPYGDKYSLVTSVDYAYKIAQKSGVWVTGFQYEFDENGKAIACSATAKRRIGQDLAEYTTTIYLDEFSTGKNLWASKPKAMLKKVAAMHVLRMACPEQLSQVYTEDEFSKESNDFDRSDITDDTIVISTGDEDGSVVIPETDTERKVLILKELKRIMPDIDTADAKEVKTVVADLTQLEMGPKSYPNIIHILSRK